ncbi:MAG: TolB family protein, partial [Janthinobacterium lividum]
EKSNALVPEASKHIEPQTEIALREALRQEEHDNPTHVPHIDSSKRRWPKRLWPLGLGGLGLFSAALLIAGLPEAYLRTYPQPPFHVGNYERLTGDGFQKDLKLTHGPIILRGKDLLFTELNGNETVLAEVPASGGETIHRPLPFRNALVADLDPVDHKKLLIGSTWQSDEPPGLVEEDLLSGATASLTSVGANDGNWSNSGKQLAFTHLGELFVRSVSGPTHLIASVGGLAYWPRWSPDDKEIRFTESYDGYHDRLWAVDSSGANLRPIFQQQSDGDRLCCGSWTKSGRAFVYLSSNFRSSSIHIRPEKTSLWHRGLDPIDIPSAPLETLSAVVPAPDEKHLYAIGAQLRGRLARIDPATRKAEPYLEGISAEGVSFSPDHKSIVWTAYPEGTLWRSRLDGTDRVQLTQPPALARFPRWSPDGSKIVFIAAAPGSDWELYTVSAGGGAVTKLLQQSNGQGAATWSPDGKALAFGHIVDMGKARTHPFALEVLHLGDKVATTVPDSTGLWTARWSPDGRFISAVTRDNHSLRLFDIARGIWTSLAQGSVNDVAWTLDSRYIFFDADLGAEPFLFRVRLTDRKVERWASLKNVHRAGFFDPWLGVTPDGAPILLEDASIQEVYSLDLDLP